MDFLVMIEEVKIEWRYTCPSEVRNSLLKYVENRYWRQWAVKKNVVEPVGDIWFEPMKTFIEQKFTNAWTQRHVSQASHGSFMEHQHERRDMNMAGQPMMSVHCVMRQAQTYIVCTSVTAGGSCAMK